MRFKSKPHTIYGFQLRRGSIDTPEWFEKALTTGKASLVNNHKECYVVLYDKYGGERKAYLGDYICINHSNTLFPLTKEELERGFEVDK